MRFVAFQVLILCFTATEETISGCLSPLGMTSGLIKDGQISASTHMSDWQLPSAGRLHNVISSRSLGAWCSGDTDKDQWFQIDLLTTTNVSAVASQGIDMGDGGHWVTKYSLSYSCDGVRWFSYTLQDGGHEIFKANNDSDSVVTNGLEVPLLARFVRIKPLAWNHLGSICLRLELYGCQTSQVCPHPTQDTTLVATTKATLLPSKAAATKTNPTSSDKSSPQRSGQWSSKHFTDSAVRTTNATPVVCSDALGMQSRAINDSQIKASSYKSSWTRPSEGRLHNQLSIKGRTLGGWCAKDSDKHPFLQVDLKKSIVITALAVQGLPLSDNSALKFKLNYSCDGKMWFEYQQGKIFEGSRSNRHARQSTLPVPLKAKLVRIRLLPKQHEKACLRLEIYGCKQADADCGNKGLTNVSINYDKNSTRDPTISTVSDAGLTKTGKRPTRPKDMIVIVNAQDQQLPNNNSAGCNTIRTFLFFTLLLFLLNYL